MILRVWARTGWQVSGYAKVMLRDMGAQAYDVVDLEMFLAQANTNHCLTVTVRWEIFLGA